MGASADLDPGGPRAACDSTVRKSEDLFTTEWPGSWPDRTTRTINKNPDDPTGGG
jgi:hypothetical protein